MTKIHSLETPSNITLEIKQFYVKEQSSKVLHGYQAFQSTEKIDNQTEMSVNKQAVAPDTFEVTLNVTVTGKSEQKTAYTVNVQQACVLKIGSKDEQQLNQIMNVYIPNLLYPYVRKAITDLVGSSGFMPLFLPVIDFASLHQQQAKIGQQDLESNAELIN